jgi:hypothetical protein
MVKGFLSSLSKERWICLGIALASQIEDLQTVVELAKCVAKYYIRKKEVSEE